MLMAIAFFTLTIGWLALPFLPALRELMNGKDTKPLSVSPTALGEIRDFARVWRNLIVENLGPALGEVAASGKEATATMPDGTRARLLPADCELELLPDERERGYSEHVVAATGDLDLPANESFLGEMHVDGMLRCGDGVILRAALATGDLSLGDGCVGLRWLHTDGELRAGQDCSLFGRVSADRAMRLETDCRFERLGAPRILTGGALDPPEAAPIKERREIKPKDLPGFVEEAGGRVLVKGNLELPAHVRLEANLVVTGKLLVGEGCEIIGSVKAHKEIVLERSCKVQGALVGGENLVAGPHCRLDGPVLAERELQLGSCCRVGSLDRPSTLSGERVKLRPGVEVHGSVRTSGWGEVLPPSRNGEEKRDA